MKVLMIPMLEQAKGGANGISRVVEAYYKYLAPYGVEFSKSTDESADLIVSHAGVSGKVCDVAHLHGLYFTSDYDAPLHEYKANANITAAVRSALEITVPSEWVAEILRRDMHVNPTVIPHGIEVDKWKNNYQKEHYVLWNKNRGGVDACTTDHLEALARHFADTDFVSTFGMSENTPPNIHVTGVVSPDAMKVMVQKCGVYLSTTKETFGIGILEAMASGVPVLGFNYGGNSILIQHKINGYLAEPGDYDDLYSGLEYCMLHSTELGKNGVELAKLWTWEKSAAILYATYERALNKRMEKDTVSVVIPCYNYAKTLERAVESVVNQTYPVQRIVIVNDGSTDDTDEVARKLGEKYENVRYIKQSNSGVAIARNTGILQTNSKYVACLDADDELAPDFVGACVYALAQDKSLGIAYTKLKFLSSTGNEIHTDWPDEFSFDLQLERRNQIPTACVFRREMFDRTGGYRQRYAPLGAGAEDAELWLRAGSLGFNAKLASHSPLFIYHAGGNTQKQGYKEVDWLNVWHPWATDGVHPFASMATPKKMSHPVHQYDRPLVSVIIPVGPGHEKTVIDALDSLEAQTFRDWEAIVVWDSDINPTQHFINAYPFAKLVYTAVPKSGAGTARNTGAKFARSKMLLFLDADDYLLAGAIEKMIRTWNQKSDSIIYSDYYGISKITDEYKEKLGDRLIEVHPKTGESLVRYYSQDYSCEKAQAAPDFVNKEIYHWCLVTCLIPKMWHDAIGGFDESMTTWEDVDYHWRMSHMGFCYTRIPDTLVVYRFSTGSRRETAIADGNSEKLLQYISNKYRSVKMSPCATCGQTPYSEQSAMRIPDNQSSPQTLAAMRGSDSNFVKCRYIHPNRGEHSVVGYATQTKYGYRAYGDEFLVHVADIAATPQFFERIEGVVREVRAPQPLANIPEQSNPVVVPDQKDFINEELLDNIKLATPFTELHDDEVAEEKLVEVKQPTRTAELIDIAPPSIVAYLKAAGIDTVAKLATTSVEELTAIKGIGQKRAEGYIAFAKTLNGE